MPKHEYTLIHKYCGCKKTITSENDIYTALRENNLDYTVWVLLESRYIVSE